MPNPPAIGERPSRRAVLGGSIAASLVGCGGPPSSDAAPLNVVVVLTDDQRYDAFSFMGHPVLRTPHLDRMAGEGAYAAHAFVTTSLCCPSRASMLTGLYAHRHGVLDNRSELPSGLLTYGQRLQQAGIDTCYVGKWHMGADNPHPRPGWTRWVGFRGQGRYRYPGPDKLPPLDRGFSYDGDFRQVSGYVTDLLTEEAVGYLRARGAEPSRPFCMVLAHKACHAPFVPAPRHAGALAEATPPEATPLGDPALADLPGWMQHLQGTDFDAARPYGTWESFAAWYRAYHATLLAVDESVGRILATLQDTGLADRTVVLYTSDNGFLLGDKGILDKRNAYEASIRVPFIAWGPTIAAGHRIQPLVLNVDLAPTILDLMGLPAPEGLHGRSVAPLLRAESETEVRYAFLYEYFHERRFPATPTMFALRTATHKLITYHGVPDGPELYDLVRDPQERTNLAGRPGQLRRQRQLAARLAEEMGRLELRAEPVWDARLSGPADRP